MAKYDAKRIAYVQQEQLLNRFCGAISKLKSATAVKRFLKDLLNRNERIMLVRRLLIAEMLIAAKTYQEIQKQLRCGRSTIARVQRWLNFGRNGYKDAIRTNQTKK